jgi:hypothetical protein
LTFLGINIACGENYEIVFEENEPGCCKEIFDIDGPD